MEKNKNDNKLNLSSVNSCGGRRKPVTWSATFFRLLCLGKRARTLQWNNCTQNCYETCYLLLSGWSPHFKVTTKEHIFQTPSNDRLINFRHNCSLQLFKDFSFQRHVYTYCLKDNKVPYCPYRSLCFQGAGLFVDLRGSKSRVGGRAIKRQTPSIHLRLGFKLSSLMKLFTFARSGNPGTFLNYAATGLMC